MTVTQYEGLKKFVGHVTLILIFICFKYSVSKSFRLKFNLNRVDSCILKVNIISFLNFVSYLLLNLVHVLQLYITGNVHFVHLHHLVKDVVDFVQGL